MEKEKIKYSIGLDIGTNSVGWAVTDSENNLLKNGRKNMWGARIFESGQGAEQTRILRGTRRRTERRKERINILQSLLIDDMERDYPNFFPMLRESYKVAEDKNYANNINSKKYNLFSDTQLTDADYYKDYPTVYHLRKELIRNKKKYDFRLVYLAIHHIIKYRGNFLYESDLKASNEEIIEDIESIIKYLEETILIDYTGTAEKFRDILIDKKIGKSTKKDQIIEMFKYDKSQKSILSAVVSAIIGYKFDLNKIFDDEISDASVSFSEEIENEDIIKEKLGENVYMYESMQREYNYFVLQDILQGKKYISDAFVIKFEKYKKDLLLLKNIYRKYLPLEYNSMFRKPDVNNYVSYDNKKEKAETKLCTADELYKRIKKDLENVEECDEKREILEQIENREFLVKINSTANASIPYQLHYQELEEILNNQSQYYETIKENKENILKLMKFRIPYYVGPLAKNSQSKFSWLIRKSDEKILPWTFEDIVDIDKTAEEFIKRMTNKCTYLINEDVIPKQSILYSKYCVLNELSNIRINNQKLTPMVKKEIIEELFKKIKSVKEKDLKNLLIDRQIYKEINSITGLAEEKRFMSNMASYIDMKNIFGDINDNNIEMIEKIIEWITIFEDKKILKKKIKDTYKLSDDTIKKLAKLKYTGWSRLSRKLLAEIKAKDDGKTVIEKLECTKENFMQIISNNKYGFDEQIKNSIENSKEDITYKQIEEIPTSPANKRSIWQAVKIVKEITKIMKCEPENIYIEFAREEQKKVRKDNRAKALLKIYDNFTNEIKNYNQNVYKELKAKQNEKDFDEKLYLYFVQNGRCMYSGKPLNIDTLSLYEVDHILPQCYVKDDSLSNKALVYKEENQRKSGSLLLNDEIINRQESWWKQLHDNGLIDDKKYYNLKRRKMFETDDDKVKFIARQLVETRQVTKYITNLLVNQYKNSDVFAIRAEITHNLRESLKVYKNRNVNDYHHAQDAYIISLVGNVINQKMQYKDEYKYTEYVKNYIKQKEDENKSGKDKSWIITGMVLNNINKEKIKRVMYYKDCYITHKLEEQTGEFYDQTLYSPRNKNKKIQIPIKNEKDICKYGGYSGEKKAYFTIYSFIDAKGNKQIELIGIPIKISYDIKNKKITLLDYIESTIKKENKEADEIKIIKSKILKYQEYLDENDEPMALLSDTEIKANKQLIVNEKINSMIYKMNNTKQSEKTEDVDEVYEYLLIKLQKEYKVFNSIYQKLNRQETKNKFEELQYIDKVKTINGLIDLMQRGQGDLSKLGLGDRAGRMSGKSFKTEKLKVMTFIDKSITGMYERRYKINGMENCCSK